MVENALLDWDLDEMDFLLIENAGNLRFFNSADVAVITKDDLAAEVEFDWEAARRSTESVRPGMQIFRLSAKIGVGLEAYLDFLAQRLSEQRALAHSGGAQLLGTCARATSVRAI